MNDEELRTWLRRLDPQATAPVDPITSPRARHLPEDTLRTEPTTDTSQGRGTSNTLEEMRAVAARGATSAWWPRRRFVTAVLAAAAVAVTAGVLWNPTSDSTPAPTSAARKSTLALALTDGTNAASCIRFGAAILTDVPVAFAAKAVSVGPDTVTLDVTHWYAGGTAQVVTLSTPGNNTSVALDGVTFEAGKDYLVPATGGTVTSCGYGGEANPTLQRAYTTAYGRACQGCFGAGISQTRDHEDTFGHPGKSRDFGC